MKQKRFHCRIDAKRRGNRLPGRLRISARRGVTLVELMIAMLVLAIVCIAWLEIIGIQSARREARRREAVERLSGMMDAFLYYTRSGGISPGDYRMTMDTGGSRIDFSQTEGGALVYPVFEDGVSPIGYRLSIVFKDDLKDQPQSFYSDWKCGGYRPPNYWLVGRLYDSHGDILPVEKPFFTLPVCIGF